MSEGKIKHIMFDYSGVFDRDDYTPVHKIVRMHSALRTSSEIDQRIGGVERRWVLAPDVVSDTAEFYRELAQALQYGGPLPALELAFNQRGDTGLYDQVGRIARANLDVSICSNQLPCRLPSVQTEIRERMPRLLPDGRHFMRALWFSNQVGLQKSFVGVKESDEGSGMDTSGKNIFDLTKMVHGFWGYEPSNVVFVDDSVKNVKGAIERGYKGVVFVGVNELFGELSDRFGVRLE